MGNKADQLSGKILVIANSARMLAQFLNKAGHEIVVIDCFADLDTRKLANDFIQVPSLALEDIKNQVRLLQSRHQLTHAIYGSGFERHCDSLDFLESFLMVLGNGSDAFRAIQNKTAFFEQLDRLSISYPLVSFQPPTNCAVWLQKPLQGEGGVGISSYSATNSTVKQVYWQHFKEGIPHSVLFVAGRDKVNIVGFQRQLIEGESSREFLFSGVVSQTDLPANCRSKVIDWVTKLAEHYQLKGLNSLDFIFKDQQCYVLEINARPTASLQLYESSVISLHIKSCLGEWQEITYNPAFFQAYKIMYAKFELDNIPSIDWPEWALDRPVAGSKIAIGEPICSIVAHAQTQQQVLESLHSKQQTIKHFLQTGLKNNAIPSQCK